MTVHGPLTRQKVDQLFEQVNKLQDKYRQQIVLMDQLKRSLVRQLVRDEGVQVHEQGYEPRLVQGEHVSVYDMNLALHTMGLSAK